MFSDQRSGSLPSKMQQNLADNEDKNKCSPGDDAIHRISFRINGQDHIMLKGY